MDKSKTNEKRTVNNVYPCQQLAATITYNDIRGPWNVLISNNEKDRREPRSCYCTAPRETSPGCAPIYLLLARNAANLLSTPPGHLLLLLSETRNTNHGPRLTNNIAAEPARTPNIALPPKVAADPP